MSGAILTCNAGSHNTKLAVHDAATLKCVAHAQTHDMAETLAWLCDAGKFGIETIVHRVVHGGLAFTAPTRITPSVIEALEKLTPLAPLHQPAALRLIAETRKLYPALAQLACFDTGFHHTLPARERWLPLPRRLHDEGMLRFGFHGISYAHIARVLPVQAGKAAADGRVVVAHLGGGSSLCAMKERRSIATSMGFSALDGLMMGTRSGAVDPGALLYLLEQKNMSPAEVSRLLYSESGLLGVSGIAGDMQALLASAAPEAAEAVELYCYLAARQLLGLLAALGGLDLLVFTGGIGEHAAPVRSAICAHLAWLGLQLDDEQNARHASRISTPESRVGVHVIPADESLELAEAGRSLAHRK